MVRKIIFWLTIIGAGLLLALLILTLFFTTPVDNWLSAQSPVEADILIVEGWVSGNSLEKAINEFKEKGYNLIITTGGPLNDAFNMSQNGYIQFDLQSAGFGWDENDSIINIVLSAYGEPAQGEYPRYTIIHDEDTIGRGYAGSTMGKFAYTYRVDEMMPGFIRVVFDNDAYTDSEDRNLHVWKLEVNDYAIPARSEFAKYVRWQNGNRIERELYPRSHAGEKAYFLISAGIDSNQIVPLVIPETRFFRTFTDAVIVSEWLKAMGMANVAVNIFTEGNHARRSQTLYRYALPDSVKVGVTGTERSEFYQSDRMDFAFGKLNTLRQLSAYLHSRIFFNHKWHYRRISNSYSEFKELKS